MLGCDIGPLEHGGLLRVSRTHVNDASAPLLVHLAQRCTRRQKGAVEMDRQQLLPLGELEIDQRGNDLNAGIADKNIERAECFDHSCGACLHLPFVTNIHTHADGALSARINLASRRISRVLIKICNRDLRTLASKNNGDVLAYPTGSTGDDGNFVLETHVNLPWLPLASGQVVVNDLAEIEGE